MHREFIATGLLLLSLLTGCSSSPDKPAPAVTKSSVKQITQCADSSQHHDNTPWTLTGQEVTGNAKHLNITQQRGEPNQFVVCDDCPCPTRKNKAIAKADNPVPVARKWVIHFRHGEATLNPEHKQTLDQLVATLPQHYRLAITGYTDDAAPGGTVSNQTVAQQRSANVTDYLARHGVAPEAITTQAKPLCCYIAPNTTESGRALNRRTEIVLVHLPTRGVEP